MREPPRMPPAADCSATGLSLNGCSFMRDTQSIAFFRPPGIDQLYSGDTMISPSALRMASTQAFTSAGKPVEFWMSKLYSGKVSNGGAGRSVIADGANAGKVRASAALYE